MTSHRERETDVSIAVIRIVAHNITLRNILHVKARKTLYVQVDIAQYCQYDFVMTLKTDQVANKWRNAPFSLFQH